MSHFWEEKASTRSPDLQHAGDNVGVAVRHLLDHPGVVKTLVQRKEGFAIRVSKNESETTPAA